MRPHNDSTPHREPSKTNYHSAYQQTTPALQRQRLLFPVCSLRPLLKDYVTSKQSARNLTLPPFFIILAKGIKDVYDMDLFNIALGEDVTALPPAYGMLDFELSGNDNIEMGVTLDEIINGEKGWAVHFSCSGKPMVDYVDPDALSRKFPQAHPGLARLTQMWNEEARAVCPMGSYPEAPKSNRKVGRPSSSHHTKL